MFNVGRKSEEALCQICYRCNGILSSISNEGSGKKGNRKHRIAIVSIKVRKINASFKAVVPKKITRSQAQKSTTGVRVVASQPQRKLNSNVHHVSKLHEVNKKVFAPKKAIFWLIARGMKTSRHEPRFDNSAEIGNAFYQGFEAK